MDTSDQLQPHSRQRASPGGLRESLRESLGTAPVPNGAPPQQDGRALVETEDLVTQLSLAPLAVQSSYAPFEGELVLLDSSAVCSIAGAMEL